MTHEINSADWSAFCQRVSQHHAGANVKLEVVEADGKKGEIAANATLQSMVFTKTDGCSDIITLRLRNDREIIHEITEPIKVLLHSTGGNDFNQMQIEAESGVEIITIHPPIHVKILEGLKAR